MSAISNGYYTNCVQSGPDFTMDVCLDTFNERLRVDDYQGSLASIDSKAQDMCAQYAFTKIFIKSRQEDLMYFLSRGYMLEAIFKGYFNGSDAYSMAKYFSPERRTSDYWIQEDHILKQVLELPGKRNSDVVTAPYRMRMAVEQDADRLANLYNLVFQVYPTPMNDPQYIRKIMQQGTVVYLIETGDAIVSAASAEINEVYHNAEMTDCATLAEHRKHGLMRLLILALENELRTRQIFCAYSLARALSFGMNAVFHQLGYLYSGRMTKNCRIVDKYEDMSLWVKDLSKPARI
ncbi:putative beta-lysine N-acetyltransferase [Aneurinibacillus sp. Ricciae_BoGa-3]|uniref:putative beta-lysine N-acetyltransferase n=1 Tax=Aneurinibacillus sp. Ricciae_BoGa-3 TaxID=3022697 RepID=UPI002341D9BE|nr:putative beta-lysine N-acetyltransferase [Aneurinibacillus sp. Ricciae_BoGa-3]WCK54965.1 putative beta-lysine N-acetyltransferase [Aneurinibacillus sp. Ricciae_BoGa-3]